MNLSPTNKQSLSSWQALACAIDFNSVIILDKALKDYKSCPSSAGSDTESHAVTWLPPGRGTARAHIPLVRAAQHADLAIVRSLLDAGASINDFDYSLSGCAFSALHAAVRRGHPAITRLLIDRGADIHAVSMSANGEVTCTALEHALGSSAPESDVTACVLALINAGANVHAPTKLGSMLHYALHMRCARACVTALIDSGADVCSLDAHKRTPLLVALERQPHAHPDGMTALIPHTRTIDHRCWLGYTALEYACVLVHKHGQVQALPRTYSHNMNESRTNDQSHSYARAHAAALIYAGARGFTRAGVRAMAKDAVWEEVWMSVWATVGVAAMTRRGAVCARRWRTIKAYRQGKYQQHQSK